MDNFRRMEITAKVYYRGEEKYTLASKGKIRLQRKNHQGGWETYLEEQVPNNKVWKVEDHINITEEDE